MGSSFCLNPFIPLEISANTYRSRLGISTLYTRERKLSTISCTRLDDTQTTNQQQLNLSVLRFTLGIPGLDESYLPRWIGYAFGSFLLLNHFVGSDSTTTTPAQLRSEALGLSLAGFSIALPYLGKFLKGATPLDQATVPESAEQIFIMSQNITDNVKEDLAWGTYVLLRNTKTISVLISVQDALCVRGYWNSPGDVLKVDALDWFQKQIQQIGLSDLNDTVYFPETADSELWEMLPKGTRSLLVQPLPRAPKGSGSQVEKTEGFVLLASSISYAYSDKDTAWIGAVANKFRGKSNFADLYCIRNNPCCAESISDLIQQIEMEVLSPIVLFLEYPISKEKTEKKKEAKVMRWRSKSIFWGKKRISKS